MRPNKQSRALPTLLLTTSLFVLSCGQQAPERLLTSQAVAVLTVMESPSYHFGDVPVNEERRQLFTVYNSGKATATQITGQLYVSSFSYTGGKFPGASGNCGSELKAGENCLIEISFKPKYAAAFEELVRISYHNGVRSAATDTEAVGGRFVLKGKGITVKPTPQP